MLNTALSYFDPFESDDRKPVTQIPALAQLDYYQIYTRAGNKIDEGDGSELDSAVLVQEFALPDNAIHADLLGWATQNSGYGTQIKTYALNTAAGYTIQDP